MATIRDVAEKAGVSIATVSRVLNKQSAVKPSTKVKVEKAIKDLNYQPNYLGRNLRRAETKLILVVLQNISNPFYAKVVKGIEDIGHKNNYNIMICNTDSDPTRERSYLELLLNKLVDGVILMAPEIEAEELDQISKNFPLVQCCEYKEGTQAPHISIDNLAAGYTAISHLIKLGHNRIGMISASNRLLSAIQREKGYKKALLDAGIEFDTDLIKYGSYGFNGGLRAAKELLNMDKSPTAIFTISDITAIGAIKAIKEKGLKVPDDIAVIGFDNTSIASMYDPQLTTIAQPRYDLGRISMEILLDIINNEDVSSKEVYLEHELVIRKSTF
ncbi:LacI family DNA-binding transcriptional regulator [Natronospora cellulosivora (SeqCode)]